MTRLNFTGRRRVRRDDVRLRVRDSNDSPVLDVLDLDLGQLNLPVDAKVVVEAYRQTSYMRFYAGTVGRLTFPTSQPLYEFESPETVRFRIKVVGTGEDDGKILAAADNLRATTEADEEAPQSSLLPTVPDALGQMLWRLDFSNDEPKLVVNRDVGDWKGFAMLPTFTALVLPEALRQIVKWVLENLEMFEEGEETPLALWVLFLAEMGHDPRDVDAEDEGERETWADEAVDRFARRYRFLDLVDDLTGATEA
jgi:hypothetical protein